MNNSQITTAQVRRALKKAGLDSAKKMTSKVGIKGGEVSWVTSPGFALKHETEYRAKRHERTGRIQVSWLTKPHQSSTDEACGLSDVHDALQAAGFNVVLDDNYPYVYVMEAE